MLWTHLGEIEKPSLQLNKSFKTEEKVEKHCWSYCDKANEATL